MALPTNALLASSDGIQLEGRVREPDSRPAGVALLLHPHPAFGGTMDVWLLPAIARRLADDGWITLRINFRGVEGSAGVQTGGRLEHADAEGALDWLTSRWPGLPSAVVGWSFGAMIGLRLGPAVDHWVGIAPPTRHLVDVPLEGPIVPDVMPPRRTVIVGAHDQFYPADTVDVLRPQTVEVLPDADHFLFDRDPQVAELVAAALAPLIAQATT